MDELQRILQPQRLQGETYEAYRARRWAANRTVKQTLKGRLFFDSGRKTVKDKEGKEIILPGKTYVKNT